MSTAKRSSHFMFLQLVLLILVIPSLLSAQSKLQEVYKSGPIQLEKSSGYGKKTDWAALFYNTFTDITAAPDGTVFAACNRQHKVFIFDPRGNLVTTFGQEGQGPGDFKHPGELSILDGMFLVVGEYATNRRISLFDLDGNFVKLLKVSEACYNPVALHDGKIAYIGKSFRRQEISQTEYQVLEFERVFIKDVTSGKETKVAEFTRKQYFVKIGNGFIGMDGISEGSTFIAHTGEGNLMVANSSQRTLDIYSVEGQKMTTFQLDIEPIPVTKTHVKKLMEARIKSVRENPRFEKEFIERHIKELARLPLNRFVGEHLRYYKELYTDSDGNILIFKNTDCLIDCPIEIRVYSPQGEFICETEIEEGRYLLIVDPRRKHMCFTRQGLYALVEDTTADDFTLLLIKVEH